jgi:hypothetical protein
MNKGLTITLVIVWVVLVVILASIIFTGAWKRTNLGKKLIRGSRRSPLRDSLLRGPGQTIREKLDEARSELDLDMFSVVLATIFLGLGFLLLERITVWGALLFATVFVIVCGRCFIKIRKRYREIQNLRLGLDGEMATGEELNQLMWHRYYVFHDFPADGFNIDHIVIGQAGVFAVETKARSKPVGMGKQGATVVFKDSCLEFPGYHDSKSVSQAKDQARWLSDFLRKSVGTPIRVSAILAIPGWMVERRSKEDGVMVINPKEAVTYVTSRNKAFDDQTIEQVKFQIEQRCRTLSPHEPL